MESAVEVSGLGEGNPSSFEQNINVDAKGGWPTFAGKIVLKVLQFATAVLPARILGANQLGNTEYLSAEHGS